MWKWLKKQIIKNLRKHINNNESEILISYLGGNRFRVRVTILGEQLINVEVNNGRIIK